MFWNWKESTDEKEQDPLESSPSNPYPKTSVESKRTIEVATKVDTVKTPFKEVIQEAEEEEE